MKLSTIKSVTKKQWLFGFVIVAIGIAVAGCMSPQSVAAHKIADRLPSVLGPAKQYDVDVDTDTFSLARGHVSHLTIVGRDVALTRFLTVDKITIDAHDLAINKSTGHLEHIGDVTVEGELGQRHLDNYIEHVKTGISGLSIALRMDDLEASVPVSVESWTTTARLSGRLAPSDAGPNTLNFGADGASVGIVPLPVRVINFALSKVNPVLDFSSTQIPVTLQSVDVIRGRLYVRGTVDLQAAMSRVNRGH